MSEYRIKDEHGLRVIEKDGRVYGVDHLIARVNRQEVMLEELRSIRSLMMEWTEDGML